MRSMRVYLACALVLFGLLPVYAIVSMLEAQHEDVETKARLRQMKEIGNTVSTQIVQNGYFENSTQAEFSAQLHAVSQAHDGRILIVNNSLVIVGDTAGKDEGKTLISEKAVRAMSGEESGEFDMAEAFAEVVLPIRVQTSEKESQVIGALVFYADNSELAKELQTLHKNSRLLFTGTAVLVAAAAYILSGMLTKSLRSLAAGLDRSTENNDGRKLLASGSYYEVEQIADAFDRMMQRMEKTEKSRQEFVSNVSHELKTPLSAIKVLSDSLVLEPNVPIEMYQEFIADINSEIDREAKIVNDLLALVKLDKTEGEMHLEEVNINRLLEIILKRLKPLALKRGIEMTLESYRSVLAQVDEVKLSLVFTNLFENAIKYNRDGGRVTVSLNADHRYFYVKVEDTGIGIPEEEQGLIFDRFYRVDKARSRETGGTGLGLSITKSAVLMHRGAIKVQSVPGVGSIFTVRIPLSFALVVQ